MSFAQRLVHRCTIKVPTYTTQDAYGTTKKVFLPENELTDVPCFYYRERGMEGVGAQRMVLTGAWVFDFLLNTPITPTCQIVHNGTLFEVEDVTPVGGTHHLTVQARKVVLE